ncbi:MAG: hypothetical protein WBX81_03645 [Nitrososphaeraceae archaeon]
MILPTQLYGSAVSCDPTINLTNQTNCAERSQPSTNPETMDDLSSDDTETPLILPDLSPTREDLNNVEREDTVKTMDSDGIENNVETISDDEDASEDTSDNDSEENDGEEARDTSSLIPFP